MRTTASTWGRTHVPSPAIPSLRRSFRMIQRNLLVYKHLWMIVFSGFFEPLFYLLGSASDWDR